MKKIAVLSSGGDAPGMNAGIRSIVRTASNNGIECYGIQRGYAGLIQNEFIKLGKYSMSNTIGVGGTKLFTARSKEFMTNEGRLKALKNLQDNEINALIVLGGDGSFRGALELAKLGVEVICVPATIDLDIDSTEYTIGFDTAINTAMECIDRIRDTSTSHERCSIIEVMGRRAGYIAIYSGISTGAEEILIPEFHTFEDVNTIGTRVKMALLKGKKHYIIINAEGVGHSMEMAKIIQDETGIETKCTILGHLQRGGIPTCKDRVYASVMGEKAVKCVIDKKKNRAIVYNCGMFTDVDLEEAVNMRKGINPDLLDTIKNLEK